jgi:dihydrofolate synthase / folylpolyglutamate synthase
MTTAAAFVLFSESPADVLLLEVGLGGRLDATNVIPSQLTVLTSVGYDHTEWLGETLEEIAAEKVAVLRDHTALLVGEVPEQVNAVIDREVAEKHAKKHWAASVANSMVAGYQGKNFALAQSAAQLVLGDLRPDVVAGFVKRLATREFAIRGRAELAPGDPPQIFDAAHNPDGAKALAEALPDLAGGRGVVCCVAILEGKDAVRIINALAPAVSGFVCTEIPPERIEGSGRPGGRSRPALEVAALCEKAGREAEAIADPLAAWERTKDLARDREGVALAAGSHYLLSSIWTERPAQSS